MSNNNEDARYMNGSSNNNNFLSNLEGLDINIETLKGMNKNDIAMLIAMRRSERNAAAKNKTQKAKNSNSGLNNNNELERAIAMSMQLAAPAPAPAPAPAKSTAVTVLNNGNALFQKQLAKAMQMSLNNSKGAAAAATTKKASKGSAAASQGRRLPAYGPDDYLQFDVRGDGNCFYRSVYNAAKYHPIPGTLDRMLRCMNHPEDEPVTEDSFNYYARQKLAYLIRYGRILEDKAAADGSPGFTLYHMLKQYAVDATKKKKVERNTLLWDLTKGEASFQIQRELLGNPAKFKNISEKKFKKLLANIVGRNKVYVSEIDVTLIDFMFANCGENSIHIQRISPDDRVAPSDTWLFDVAPGEQPGPPVPNILIRRLREHYNFYVKGSVFAANEEKRQAAIRGTAPGDEIEEIFTADRTAVIEKLRRKEEAEKKRQEELRAREAAEKAAKNAKALVNVTRKNNKKHNNDYGLNSENSTSSEYSTNVVSNWSENTNSENAAAAPPPYRPIPYRLVSAPAAAKSTKAAAPAKSAAPAKPAPVSVTAKTYPATKPVTATKPASKVTASAVSDVVTGNAFNSILEKARAAKKAATLKATKRTNAAAQTRKAPKLAIPEEPLSNTTAENSNNESSAEPLAGIKVQQQLAKQLASTPMTKRQSAQPLSQQLMAKPARRKERTVTRVRKPSSSNEEEEEENSSN